MKFKANCGVALQVAKGLESVRLTLQGLHTTQWNIVMAFLKQKVKNFADPQKQSIYCLVCMKSRSIMHHAICRDLPKIADLV